jgi:general nucleoside transport system ATP-binding protein
MSDSAILSMKGIRKSFETSVALDNVDYELNSREIHGLLGGNGAGKTTLMNVLYGLYRADAGEITLHGRKIDIQSPRDAITHGIGMVHQHFLQVQTFPVIQNIVLGTPLKNRYTLNLDEETHKVKELSDRFGLDVDLLALIEDLPMGLRQKVEILKALYRGVEILILDEPTTSLTPQEVDALFVSLRVMVQEGMSIVFITHKLREVLSVCDRISVLREGKNVLTLPRDEASDEAFVRAMVGEELDLKKSILFTKTKAAVPTIITDRQPVLQIEELQVKSAEAVTLVKNCSLTVYKGEILGIAGVAGNGQRELAESLLSIRPIAAGSIKINGAPTTLLTTSELLQSGVAYIPEDRLHDGFLPKANVAQNLILGAHHQEPYSKNNFLNWKTIYETSRRLIGEYQIHTSGPLEVGANLSGGNIQRVLIARAFSRPCNLLVAHNPTRGLDIPSMDFVYSKLIEEKAKGMATLLLSEDLDELLLLCDRIAAIYRGSIVGILERHEFDKYEIGRLMSGVRASAA